MSGDDDLLERATRALRAAPPPSEEELRIERAVLLRAHRLAAQKSTSERRMVRWVLPLAAVLTAGSALAATGQIERAVEAISGLFGPTAVESDERRTTRARTHVEQRAKPLAPSAVDAQVAREPEPNVTAAPEPSVAIEPKPSVAPAPRRRARAAEKRAQAVAPPEGPELADAAPAAESEPPVQPVNGDLLRYREAHRLHFRSRDFWSALHAWDSYLRTYPDGTFAIEARYNRAICLVRLGRKAEARRALAPFAAGEVGRGYRKTDAAELLEALE